ncbi:MAG: hypothetical protein KBD47_01310 [Candidatus Pacebacteria bacterium]|nr:hypothetical protein [Candidatus Paceibacterota bacterium]
MHTTIDSAGKILTKSLHFYKKHWEDLIRLMLGIIGLYILAILIGLGITGVFAPLSFLIPAGLGVIVQQIVGLCLATFSTFAVPKFIHDLDQGKKPAVYETFAFVSKHFLEYFATTILVISLVYGGSVALIVPGIIFAIGMVLYPFIAAIDGKRGMSALVTSYWQTYGNKLKVFWILVVTGLFVFAVMIGSMVLSGVLIATSIVVFQTMTMKVIFIAPILVANFLFILFIVIPFSAIPKYILYKEIQSKARDIDHTFKVKKEKMFSVFVVIGFIIFTLILVSSVLAPTM